MSYAYENTHPLGASGAYGGIPEDMLMRKMEITPMYENPTQVEDNLRMLLSDFKPDKAYFASDVARVADEFNIGHGSRERLSLRHSGARIEDEPYLPDGTYLGAIGHLDARDPRGSAVDPDYRKGVEQQYARAGLIKHYNDSDMSVVESGITPTTMVANQALGRNIFKNQYQNFEESMGGWHNGGTAQTRREFGDLPKYTMDGTIVDLVDASQGNRSDAVARLSADPTVAPRQSTPDHRFKISKYGHVKTSQFAKDNDWSNNRLSTYSDEKKVALINGQMVNKAVAMLIYSPEGLRNTRQEVNKGVDFHFSRDTQQTRKKKLKPEELYRLMMIDRTSPDNPNSKFFNRMMARKANQTNRDLEKMMRASRMNHEISESMQQAVKKLRTREVKDLRDEVYETASKVELYQEGFNTRRKTKSEDIKRRSMGVHEVKDSKAVANYGAVKPRQGNDVMKMDGKESFGARSTQTKQRSKSNKHTNRSVTDNEYDQDLSVHEFGVYDKAFKADSHSHMGRNLQHATIDTLDDETFI